MIKKIIGVALLATAAGAYFLSKKKEEEPVLPVDNTARDLYMKELTKPGNVINYFTTLIEKDGVPRGTSFSGKIVDNGTYYIGDNKFVFFTLDVLNNTGSTKVPGSANPNSNQTNSNTSQSNTSADIGAGAGSSFGMSGVAQLMN